MTRFYLLGVLIALIGGCAHVAPVVEPPVVDCAKAVAPSILPAVESALVANDYVAQLEILAKNFGLCVINKAVTQIAGEALQDVAYASGDINARLKVQHAAKWMAANPV